MTRTEREFRSNRKLVLAVVVVVVVASVAGVAYYATLPAPTPTPTPTPARKPFHVWNGSGATIAFYIRIENDTNAVYYPCRVIWQECNDSNITVEIEVSFNYSDCILIERVDTILKPTEDGRTNQTRYILFPHNSTLSYEFPFHPKDIVKAGPFSNVELHIELKILECYMGELKDGEIKIPPLMITIYRQW